MIGGYYLAEAFMYGSMEAAIISIYTNILQASLSIVTFLIVYNLLIKVKIISKISKPPVKLVVCTGPIRAACWLAD